MDIERRVNEIFDEIVEIRRNFHMYPELSEEEYETCNRICKCLDKWGVEYYKGVAKTGVVAIVRGKKKGKTVAARADIDALPILEKNNLPFKSVTDGVMHACGHDVHTAIHLGVVKLFKEMEDELEGVVKIFFQPAEETVGGADSMIKEGYLKDPDVDYITSLHLLPELDAGYVELKYGALNAATNEFSITIHGKSGHGAHPEQCVDAIVIAGHIITSLQVLVSRNVSPVDPIVLTLGQINGGTKNNIITGEVIMSGTLRTLNPEVRVFAKNRIEEIALNTAKAFGGSATVEFEEGYPALINDDYVMDVLKETAENILGKDKVIIKEQPSMGADDFSYFTKEISGAYYNLGCGNKSKGWVASLHSEHFMVDEECIKTGIRLQIETLLELLKK